MSRSPVAIAAISPHEHFGARLQVIFDSNPSVRAFWTLDHYPWPHEMEQFAKITPCVLFLDYSDPCRARALAAEVDRSMPAIVTIVVAPNVEQLDLRDLMEVGVREVISESSSAFTFLEAFDRSKRRLLQEPDGSSTGAPLFAFLPARPGSGATTIAVQTAVAAARRSQRRTLLIDFDLRLGMTSFLLKLSGDRSVLDALSLGSRLDDTLWEGLVNRRGMLEILASGPVDFGREHIDPVADDLLAFARKRYYAVCVDLPGELRHHEVETLQQAQEIFLICTPEVQNLYMARRQADALRDIDALPRVSLIVNRANEKGAGRLTVRQIEEIMSMPVLMSLPSGEAEIAEAAGEGGSVGIKSPFGKQIDALSRRIATDGPAPKQEARGRTFIDYFSISSVRDKISRR